MALINDKLLLTLEKRDYEISDDRIPGFVIRCRKSGNHVYRVRLGSKNWATIGRVSRLTPAAARTRAERMRGTLANQVFEAKLKQPNLSMSQVREQLHAQGRLKDSGEMPTFETFLNGRYKELAKPELANVDQMIADLTSSFKEFLPLRLTEITQARVEDWRRRRLDKVVEATVDKNVNCLRGVLRRAFEDQILPAHPLKDIEKLQTDDDPESHPPRYLTPEQETRLRDALVARDRERRLARQKENTRQRGRRYKERSVYGEYTDHITPIVLLALNTGLRRGEVLQLRWDDWRQEPVQHLTVTGFSRKRKQRTKTKKSRMVPLNPDAQDVLRTWQRITKGKGTDLVFPGDNKQAIKSIKTAWKNLLKRAEITEFRFHDVRHQFASSVAMTSGSIYTVQKLLGHTTPKMTQRYAHLVDAHLMDAVEKIVRHPRLQKRQRAEAEAAAQTQEAK